MVKSFANEVSGGWLRAQAHARLPRVRSDFDRAHRTTIDQRVQPEGGPQDVSEGSLSKPEPTLKPQSQRGRRQSPPVPSPNFDGPSTMHDQSHGWLRAQAEASQHNMGSQQYTLPEADPTQTQFNTQTSSPTITSSQDYGPSRD